MFDNQKQILIDKEIKILTDLINKNNDMIINQGISQKSKEQRLSQEIETYANKKIMETFNNHKNKFSKLKSIANNNGSSKSPYELLLIFDFKRDEDVYVDIKPINTIKLNSAPFMGTISKYIKRYKSNKFYDLFFIVKYESEINKLPVFKSVYHHFVKDIDNYTLYNNWQLQINIKNIKITYHKNPKNWKEQLKKLLIKLENEGILKMKNRINKLKNQLE